MDHCSFPPSFSDVVKGSTNNGHINNNKKKTNQNTSVIWKQNSQQLTKLTKSANKNLNHTHVS
jgi:hypothetical protein